MPPLQIFAPNTHKFLRETIPGHPENLEIITPPVPEL